MNDEILKLVESISDKDKVPAYQNGFFVLTPEELEAFYRAAFNRGIEDAAKVCESKNPNPDQWSPAYEHVEKRLAIDCAKEIRALEMKP